MRSVTLSSSEGVLLRRVLALNLNLASSVSSPKPNLISSRYSRKCCINMCDGRFTHKDSDNSHTIEFRFPNSSSLSAKKLMQNMDMRSSSDNSTSTIKSIRESHIYEDTPALDMPFNSYLKFALLCGFFILQGTGQAAAGSDFDTGFQSNSFFGDLNDISTGFTSVHDLTDQNGDFFTPAARRSSVRL